MGKLYVVPTPIGNLADMTFRAVDVLKKVDLIAAEDTRTTRKLLDHYGIETPMMVYQGHNEELQAKKMLERLKYEDVALVSDAGTPGISDPGFRLFQLVVEAGIELIPLPGANAVLPALIGSGFALDRFVFLGFLPKKEGALAKVLSDHKQDKKTLVVYESPYRILKTLTKIREVLGNRQVCIAREISKKYEEFVRLEVDRAIEVFAENKVAGEVVLVVEGSNEEKIWNERQVMQRLEELQDEGMGMSVAAKHVAGESGWKKKQVYELGLRTQNEQ